MTQSTTLRFTEGSSDKVYTARIVPKGSDTFTVEFEYGRYGSAMQTGSKTATPVTLDQAEKIYNKLLNEKKAKGYSESASGKAYEGTDLAGRDTGIRVQLLNPIENEAELETFICDPAYCAQEKYDAERRSIVIDGESVIGGNRKGLSVALAGEVVDIVRTKLKVTGQTIIDCEDYGTTVAPFDLLMINGQDIRDKPYRERLSQLEVLIADAPEMVQIKTAYSAAEKRALVNRLREQGFEGVVFKRLDAPYSAGRPNSGGDQRKYKFVESASCRVIEGKQDKRSVGLEVLDTATALWQFIGNVTIPANFAMPAAGAIVEVKYLYCVSALIQPVFAGIRRDVDASDCTTAQLKYKQAAKHSQAA